MEMGAAAGTDEMEGEIEWSSLARGHPCLHP